MGDYFVYAITVQNLAASVAYAWAGDWVRAVYWFGGTMLVGSTVFMSGR